MSGDQKKTWHGIPRDEIPWLPTVDAVWKLERERQIDRVCALVQDAGLVLVSAAPVG